MISVTRRSTMTTLVLIFLASLDSVGSFSTPTSSLSRAITAKSVTLRKAHFKYGRTALSMNEAVADPTDDDPLFEPIGVGVKRDFSNRLPLYKSDITDGLNVQCLAATLFLFFACLAPAVGFGGLFGIVTNGAMGTMEMVISTAACGVLYALFSAQPLTIIGSTGPVLAFVATLVQLANGLGLPFLPLYSFTGLWTSLILLVCSMTSASSLVSYLTRFTDEVFSTLISAIFVVEAVSDVGRTFSSPASTFTKALLTVLCATVTLIVSIAIKSLRNSVYFTKRIRNMASNFAPTIGIVTASLLARWARIAHGGGVAGLPALALPTTFGTTSGRPWFVPIFDLPVWARWAAFFPALMASVLLFLDQNITVRLVNSPNYKMEKGRRKGSMIDGMHADMLVLSILTAALSLVGFPWLAAATVRSISHVRALSKYDDEGRASGSVEQRVTGLSIHALIGCCVLFASPRKLLTNVPLPVLMGLFLFLGVSSLPGNEMWERILGFFKDKSVAPKERWSSVPNKVVNTFTVIQVACLAAMFYVKESKFGVFFPVIIAMLAPLRYGLEKTGVITKEYMDVLDEE